jgi:uncharacterized beta-barrel protein YwiB (DUF1934 family)
MEIPVRVNVKTTIDEGESYELMVFGRYFEKDQASFLKYEEAQEEGSVRTIVKWSGEDMLILRGGAVKMRLPFRLNKKLNGSYELPFGVFETTTMARKMAITMEKGSGYVEIEYDFAMQGEHAGRYRMEITFQEETQ